MITFINGKKILQIEGPVELELQSGDYALILLIDGGERQFEFKVSIPPIEFLTKYGDAYMSHLSSYLNDPAVYSIDIKGAAEYVIPG